MHFNFQAWLNLKERFSDEETIRQMNIQVSYRRWCISCIQFTALVTEFNI